MKEIREITSDEKKIKLIRGQKGNVGWEVSVSGQDMEKILTEIQATDEKLKTAYQDQEKA